MTSICHVSMTNKYSGMHGTFFLGLHAILLCHGTQLTQICMLVYIYFGIEKFDHLDHNIGINYRGLQRRDPLHCLNTLGSYQGFAYMLDEETVLSSFS